jgi:hypothetical protein
MEPTREHLAEGIRQKITETMFWLQQAAEAGSVNNEDLMQIMQMISEMEELDLNIARVFEGDKS